VREDSIDKVLFMKRDTDLPILSWFMAEESWVLNMIGSLHCGHFLSTLNSWIRRRRQLSWKM
jgi:hypothetical protein